MSTSGPTASRTVCTLRTAVSSTSLLTNVRHAPGSGSNFNAVKPRSTTLHAASASSSGVFASPNHPFAYTRTRSRQAPPSSMYTGAPSFFPVMSHIACSSPLSAQYRSIAPRRVAKSSYATCMKCLMCIGFRPTR